MSKCNMSRPKTESETRPFFMNGLPCHVVFDAVPRLSQETMRVPAIMYLPQVPAVTGREVRT
jgi:hypothetical protein